MKSALNSQAIKRICAVLKQLIADFPEQSFERDACSGLEDLELKQRVDHLIGVLANYLPDDFDQAAEVLLHVKAKWDWGDESDPHRSFAAWPLVDYVAVYGLSQPELALKVLKQLTPLFSAEFAIRPFIEQHFELTYQTLLIWCQHDDEHVRRLASEGSRPRLPWGKQLSQFCDDPQPLFPLLELLKDDQSLYVRRSVANNLNDISKDHPDSVIRLCQQWMEEASQQRQWVIKHGLRSLVKQGRPEVFPLLGYTAEPKVNVIAFKSEQSAISLGDSLNFSTQLQSQSTQEQVLVIDYRVHHQKANGSRTSKVFKWKNIVLRANQTLDLSKSHSFKWISTRRYYAGEHAIELLINGLSVSNINFELTV